jgi:hypothetical protein
MKVTVAPGRDGLAEEVTRAVTAAGRIVRVPLTKLIA